MAPPSDVHLGIAPFTDHGDVRCTRTFQVPGYTGPSKASPTMRRCFRADGHLTVSVLALGQDQDEAAISGGIDEVWSRQG